MGFSKKRKKTHVPNKRKQIRIICKAVFVDLYSKVLFSKKINDISWIGNLPIIYFKKNQLNYGYSFSSEYNSIDINFCWAVGQ